VTFFHVTDRNITLHDSKPNLVEELPNGTYGLRYSPETGVYLEVIEPFDMPEKLYGDIAERAERIKSTYADRPNVTGVLLCGEKGSGKTLLGKKVALDLLAEGQPIIVVNMAMAGDMFGTFLQRLKKPVTLFFDEFEKIYPPKSQEGLLTLLDGVYPFKGLAILTSNSSENMADALKNRPGRIFYSLTYDGLDYQFAEEYAAEKLKDKSKLEEVMRLVTLATINFDQLKALIEEMNRYNEGAVSAVQMLNIDVSAAAGSLSILNVIDKYGDEIPLKDLKKTSLYMGYGDQRIYYAKPNHAGVTVADFLKADTESDNPRYMWRYYMTQWPQLTEYNALENRNAVLPFIPGDFEVDLDGDEENDEGVKTTVKAGKNNTLIVNDKDGHKLILKRVKISYRKTF
jgi:SpoVK/Ycf46/Vps4 family AAA+-type ATPase